MINSNEEEWVFGGYGSWKLVSRGWVLEKNKWESLICGKAVSGRHLQTRLLVCSQSDKVRLCWLALMKTSNFPIFFFFLPSGNTTQIKQLYIKPVYSPLFLLNCNFLLLSQGDGLIVHYVWLSASLVILKSEIKTKMVHNHDSDLLRPIKSFKTQPSATHTQSSSWPSSPTFWWQTRWWHNSFWDWNPFLIDGAINSQVHCCNLCSHRL